VSKNIIEASGQALADSLELPLLRAAMGSGLRPQDVTA
jgi:hypothetical protein